MPVQNVTAQRQVYNKASETENFGFDATIVPTSLNYTLAWTNGTGSGQIDLHYEKGGSEGAWTLAGGASATLTLSALTDNLGRTIPFVKIVDFDLYVVSRTAGDYLTLGSAGTNPWTTGPWGSGTQKVFKAFSFSADLTDAFTVTASSSDQLKILNSGSNPITLKLAIKGRSA